jgi:hypothetical protein
MADVALGSPAVSRWPTRIGRIIELLCLVMLVAVMATVIYGLSLRAQYERSYWGAVGVAAIGAAIILIGLAQQAIAARDAATWRDMATWQIRAARDKLAKRAGAGDRRTDFGPGSALYDAYVIEALIEDMQRASEDARDDDDGRDDVDENGVDENGGGENGGNLKPGTSGAGASDDR